MNRNRENVDLTDGGHKFVNSINVMSNTFTIFPRYGRVGSLIMSGDHYKTPRGKNIIKNKLNANINTKQIPFQGGILMLTLGMTAMMVRTQNLEVRDIGQGQGFVTIRGHEIQVVVSFKKYYIALF